MRRREAALWAGTTLPLAGVAAVVYLFFEWLFIITMASPTAALPVASRMLVLAKSPLPFLLPLTGMQLVCSALALVAYPRLRWVAAVPAGVIGGLFVLVMIDNFTYTLLRFGIVNAPDMSRPLYAAALAVCSVLAGRKILGWLEIVPGRRWVAATACALTFVMAAAPLVASAVARSVDPDAPPQVAHSGGGERGRPNVLFVGIDGADATALSAYGHQRPTTPFLEKLARESLFFENAFANVGRTHGSLVSLLTGRSPFSTHVTFPPTVLQGVDARRNLAAALKPLGYTTLQLGMRHYADAEDAHLLGFDAANYRWQETDGVPRAEKMGDESDLFLATLIDRIDERLGTIFGFRQAINGFAVVQGERPSPYWSDARRVETLTRYFRAAPEPWFVHVHLLDTHCCAYRPAAPVPGWSSYESVIKQADGYVQRLYEALETNGLLDETIVVVYSDHTSKWTTNGRVPLMVRFPSATPRGRVAANVQLSDVAPTVIASLGAPIPEWIDGVSVAEPGHIDAERALFGVSDIGPRETVAPWLRTLSEHGPPYYGAASVTMVKGSQWFELNLTDGTLASGDVPGHTVPARIPVSEPEARRLLQAELQRVGFPPPAAPEAVPDERASPRQIANAPQSER